MDKLTTPDPLPTDAQRHALAELIAFALVMIRHHCREGKILQAEDLADAFHNIPREMYGWGHFSWDAFEGMLEAYESKHCDGEKPYSGRLREIQVGSKPCS